MAKKQQVRRLNEQAKLLGPGYLTLQDTARICGVTRMAVGFWVRDRKVLALRVRRRVYVERASLASYLGAEAAEKLGVVP